MVAKNLDAFVVKVFQKVDKNALKGSLNMDKKPHFVEDIVDIAVRRGKVNYQVKWLGFPSSQNTWEPFENLNKCENLIRQCETKIIRNLNSYYFEEQRGIPEEILDVFRFSGVKVAKVKFVESEEMNFISYDEVREKYPQLLLNYYLRATLNTID